MPPRRGAIATRRRSSSARTAYKDKASAALLRARKSTAAARRRYKASASRDQYSQLGWTLAGGVAGGAAAGFFPSGLFGFDPRLIGGIALAAACIATSKSPGISRPTCGLASGMLAGYLSDTAADMIGGGAPDEEA